MGRPYRDQRTYGRIFGFDERCEEAIQRTMERENITRAEIAERIGCRKGRIQTSHLIEVEFSAWKEYIKRLQSAKTESEDK